MPTDSTTAFPVSTAPLSLVILLKSPHQYVSDLKHTILSVYDAHDI